MDFNKINNWEKEWWGTCQNIYGEETKQFLYANRMGFRTFHDGKSPFNFNAQNKSIIDIGGGPCSLLLKFHNLKKGKVIDPCNYPDWIYERYNLAGIEIDKIKGEDFIEEGYDICLIYNVLQHVENPELVIKNALNSAKALHIFEWINLDISDGHPHKLTEESLNKWLNGYGKVEELKGENTCSGTCYYGIFPGKGFNLIL